MSTNHQVSVAVVGASGYTGAELLRLIVGHPQMRLAAVYGHSTAGKPLAEVFPAFAHSELILQAFSAEAVAECAQVVFLALPHGTSQEAAYQLRLRGLIVIDLSADHRFDDCALYERVYGAKHRYPKLLKEAIYGLPEFNREMIKTSQFVACPGCYPTSVALAVYPALNADLLSSLEVIADCKSGVSGAGRSAKVNSLFAERGETIQGYKTLAHRHAPEMEMSLSTQRPIDHSLMKEPIKVHFAPHLIPMSRGILSTVYLRLKPQVNLDVVRKTYITAYNIEPFVTVLSEGLHPTTLAVRASNRCHLGLTVQGGLLVVHAAIDNLGKGAAGQAIQCFNIIFEFEETLGLSQVGVYP